MKTNSIKSLRREIDQIDAQIVELLAKRAHHAVDIGKLKREQGLPHFDGGREKDLIESCMRRNKGPLQDKALKAVFKEIVSACRELQSPTRVSFLGPLATFTHMAALEFFGSSAELTPVNSIVDVFREVQAGRTHLGVAPVENSSEGAVGLTLDQLATSGLKICGEIYLRISHALLSNEKDLGSIERVYSHPQALAQCIGWLGSNLSAAPLIQMSSTASAARRVAGEEKSAAVGSEMLAEIYGLNVVAREIQDRTENLTRFVVVGKDEIQRTGRDKTSIVFSVAHHPGSLGSALKPFADHGVNLTRIESRPSKETPWEYVFFVDFEGHTSDRSVEQVIDELAANVERLHVLGSYPAGDPKCVSSTDKRKIPVLQAVV